MFSQTEVYFEKIQSEIELQRIPPCIFRGIDSGVLYIYVQPATRDF